MFLIIFIMAFIALGKIFPHQIVCWHEYQEQCWYQGIKKLLTMLYHL